MVPLALGKKTNGTRRWIAVLVVVILLLVGFLIHRAGSSGPGTPRTESHSVQIEATHNSSRSATVANGDSDFIDFRTIALVNQSDHPVMRAIARRLADDLLDRDIAGEVELYDAAAPGAMPEPGHPLPSTFVMLDLTRFDQSGKLSDGRTVDATLSASIGPDLWGSRNRYFDPLTPPFVQANSSITIEHHSVATGSESPDAPYTALIDNLAAEAIEQINGQIAEWSAKFDTMPELPEGLMPAYRPVPDEIPLPEHPTLTQLVSGRRVMAHNHTVWSLDTDDPSALLKDFRDQLEARDWKVGGGQVENDGELSHFRATRDERGRVLEAFATRSPWERSTATGPEKVVIHYLDRMTVDEMQPAFEGLMDDGQVDPLGLLPFAQNMSSTTSERLWDMLAKRKDLPLAAELRVIRHLDQRGESDQARERLGHARLLALFEADEPRKEVDDLAEEIGGETDPEPFVPTDAQLEAIGAVPLVPGATVSAEVGLDTPAKFYERLPDQLVLLAAIIERADIAEGTYTLSFADRTEGSPTGGGSTSVTPHHPASPWTTLLSHNDRHACATEIGPNLFRVDLTSRQPE